MHNVFVHKCPDCDLKFSTKREKMNHHKASHGSSKCGECFEEFKSSYFLLRHMLKMHNNGHFKCDTCGKEFTLRKKFNKHMSNHKMHHMCDTCGFKSKSKAHMEQHMTKHTGEKPFKVIRFFYYY